MKKKCVESNNTDTKNINDVLYYELLVNIFKAFNIVDLAIVSRVCKTWREACSDPKLWHKLNLSVLCYKPFNKDSSEGLTKVLRGILTQSEVGHIPCFMFNYYTYLKNEHLLLVAESLWIGLESITITCMINHKNIFPAIGKYCKGITGLKFTTGFKMDHARALIEHTPNLKFLSLQSIIVSFRTLYCVLENLKHLEIINLCHSLIIDKPDTSNWVVLYIFHQLQHHQWPLLHRLRKILTCQSNNGCVTCKNKMTGQNYLTKKVLYESFE
ncbi:hypothetical protein Ahy_B04g071826 [Arachis hypogaea]|uniref:F-box domain-containing protein n=1 Tax=Arachis hypogaea TaxID=3818 RepID=A0A444ZLS4_ARAHY|nr:hypothetical protein Ahy_B04g071826 [Arachis hypogaea]